MNKKKFLIFPVLSIFLLFFFSSCTIGGTEAGLLGTWRVISWDQRGITSVTGTLHFAANDRYRMEVKLGTTLGMPVNIGWKGRILYPDSLNKRFILDADEGEQTDCTYRLLGSQLTIESSLWTIELTR